MCERFPTAKIEQILSKGYAHFQSWWLQTVDCLPEKEILKRAAQISSFPNEDTDDIEDRQSVYLQLGKIPNPRDPQQNLDLDIKPPLFYLTPSYIPFDNVCQFLITTPIDRRYISLEHPYLRIEWDTSIDMNHLLALRVRHHRGASPLLQSQFTFDPQNKAVKSITQITKDNAFFANPVPHQERKRREQVFYFYCQTSGEMGYVFRYRAKKHAHHYFHCPFSRGGPFPPYQGYLELNLPEAIEKAFKFEPVV